MLFPYVHNTYRSAKQKRFYYYFCTKKNRSELVELALVFCDYSKPSKKSKDNDDLASDTAHLHFECNKQSVQYCMCKEEEEKDLDRKFSLLSRLVGIEELLQSVKA